MRRFLALALLAPSLAVYDLTLLYLSDMEDKPGQNAVNTAAIVDKVRADEANTLLLSAGDNWIPGPFYSAGAFSDVSDALSAAYNAKFSLTGQDPGCASAACQTATADDANCKCYRDLDAWPGGIPGSADIAILNVMGFDASCVGNHEFDMGPAGLFDVVAAYPRYAGLATDRATGAMFPYLSANLDFSGDGDLGGIDTTALLPNTGYSQTLGAAHANANKYTTSLVQLGKATTITVNGEKIGIVGLTTPILAHISSPGSVTASGTGGLTQYPDGAAEVATVTDALAAVVNPVIQTVIDDGCTIIVLLSHLQQVQMDEALAPKLKGVDVIVSGGSGTDMTANTDIKKTTNVNGDPLWIVGTPGDAKKLGRLDLQFDAQGKIVAANSAGQGYDTTLASTVTTAGGDTTAGNALQVNNIITAVQTVVQAKDTSIHGYTGVYLDGRRGSIRTKATNFGNLAADSQLWYAQARDSTVQVSLKNGGGLRAPIGTITGDGIMSAPAAKTVSADGYAKPAGAISQLDVENTLRFNNGLVIVDTTAAGLHELMEHAVSGSAPGNTPGQFPQVAGMKFSYEYAADCDTATAGTQRIRALYIVNDAGVATDTIVENCALKGDGTRVVKMVSLDFLVNNNGDSYPFVDDAGNGVTGVSTAITDVLETAGGSQASEQTALAEYLAQYHASAATGITMTGGMGRIQDLANCPATAKDTTCGARKVGDWCECPAKDPDPADMDLAFTIVGIALAILTIGAVSYYMCRSKAKEEGSKEVSLTKGRTSV